MTDLPTVVAIGASAGGLEALQNFVKAVPNDSGLAYVVIQHLSPDQPSLMDKLLGAHTPVPVVRIEDGAPIQPDHIYVIPPGPFAEIENGKFKLIDHAREEGVRTPIDRFFTSLAETLERRAFAIVLSGTGSDGTTGIRAIKANGGIALVQESGSAKFPGMPDSAAATGLVDFALRPSDMPARILDIVRHRLQIEEDGGRQDLLGEVEGRLDEILDLLDTERGTAFSGYKPGTLVRRVARRMTLLRQRTIDGYLRTLSDREEERELLTQDFLIGVTRFFRDHETFGTIAEKVLKPLLDSTQPSFRVWVPGCSTGDEAYSIAILVSEMAEAREDKRPWKIFGTDIDLDALRHARAGRFSSAAIEGLSEERRERFFTRDEEFWHTNTHLREMCVFAPHNLLTDAPFSKLDLVSCRNVMIYLNTDSQAKLLPRFHYALKESRFLWLGPSESLGRNERLFQAVDRGAKLFRRDDTVTPSFSSLSADRGRVSSGVAKASQRDVRSPKPGAGNVVSLSEQLFLQRCAAPFATVNRQNEVIYVSEAMTNLIKPSSGVPSTALDDFLTTELRLPVHSALDEARNSGLHAEIRNVVAQIGDVPYLFDVAVVPFSGDSDLMLVTLTEVRSRDLQKIDEFAGRHEDSYGQELLLTRKRLVALEQEFETSEQELRGANEELLSMNEELQSSNEELETSREELQSINEELETINAELSENNRQLTRANSDLKNLLESTNIATLFIDENDCVRLYTPEVSRLFGVRDRDVGRSIHDLASRVDYPELAQDADTARKTLQPVEREIRIDATDETFQTRVSPYRTVDNRIDGVVITFIDISTRIRHERQLENNARVLREQYSELETLYDTAPIGLNLLDRNLRYIRVNAQLAAINGLPVDAHIGRYQSDLIPEAHREVSEVQRRVLETGEPAYGLSVRTETPAAPGQGREFLCDFYPVRDQDEVVAVGSCVREVTHEKELERQIAESAVRQKVAVDAAGLGVFEWDMSRDRALWENDKMYEIFGHPREEGPINFEAFRDDVLHPDSLAPFSASIEEARKTKVLNTQIRIKRKSDGAQLHLQYFGSVQKDAEGNERMIGVVADVTEQSLAAAREAEHRERLQTLQDSLSTFVGMLTPDGTLVEVNATALERGGLTRDDVIGHKFWDCWWWSFSTASRERVRIAVEKAAAGTGSRYDVPARMAGGEMRMIDFQLVPRKDETGAVTEIIPSAVDVTERVEAERRKDILLAELEHRVKNILATVQAVARFTARMSTDKDRMAENLISRLSAISRTHDALTASGWQGQSLRSLAEAEVAPYVDPENDRFSYIGDEIALSPDIAMSLGLALHELATNAAKYGAYSTDSGRVEVTVRAKNGQVAMLEWRERDGPRVVPPQHDGFGTFLIQTLLKRELEASIAVHYEEGGLRCIVRAEP